MELVPLSGVRLKIRKGISKIVIPCSRRHRNNIHMMEMTKMKVNHPRREGSKAEKPGLNSII